MNQKEQPSKSRSVNFMKKMFLYFFKIALAVGIIYFLVQGNLGKIVKNIKNFNYWWIIPAAICYYIHFMVASWRWYKLTKVLEVNITLRDAIFLSMKSFFFSLVIPGGAIGGDVAKVGFLSAHAQKGKKIEGAFSILMDRITGMLALFILTIIITIISTPLLMTVNADVLYQMADVENSPETIKAFKYCVIAAILLMCLSGIGAFFAMFMHKQLKKISPIAKLWDWTDKKAHGAVSRMTNAIDLYRDKIPLLINMVLVSMIFIHLNMVLIVFFIIKGLGLSVKELSVLAGVILGNIAGLIPLTPAGIGFRDYTIAKLLEAGGVLFEQGESAALLFTALIITANISGGIFYILDTKKQIKK